MVKIKINKTASKKIVVKKKIKTRTTQILRYPRLDTVIMVEDAIKKYDGEFKKRALWENLPKKMMYQTYCVIIDYLYENNKISIDAEGKVGWVFYPEKVKELLSKNKHLFWNG